MTDLILGQPNCVSPTLRLPARAGKLLSVTGVEDPSNFPTLVGQVLRVTTILLHGLITVISLL